jgi:hypothetical protein
VLRDARHAAVTGDEALIERAYTEDVTGWSPVTEVTSRDDLKADPHPQLPPVLERGRADRRAGLLPED